LTHIPRWATTGRVAYNVVCMVMHFPHWSLLGYPTVDSGFLSKPETSKIPPLHEP